MSAFQAQMAAVEASVFSQGLMLIPLSRGITRHSEYLNDLHLKGAGVQPDAPLAAAGCRVRRNSAGWCRRVATRSKLPRWSAGRREPEVQAIGTLACALGRLWAGPFTTWCCMANVIHGTLFPPRSTSGLRGRGKRVKGVAIG